MSLAEAQSTDEEVLRRLAVIDQRLLDLAATVERTEEKGEELSNELAEVKVLASTVDAEGKMVVAFLVLLIGMVAWTAKEVYAQKGGRRLSAEELDAIRDAVKDAVPEKRQANAASPGAQV